jgi:hypothetical protein
MQHDRSLANFLLEINQHIPTETLPLYQQIGWPHLPRPHQTPEEMNFTGEMEGEYLCFALIRENQETDKYKIAAYPLKIYPDGRLVMKFEKRKKHDGTEYIVEYYGRAFNNTGASRLFLYFDMRREQVEKKTFHLSMYFNVKPSNQIRTAYGVSNRFVHTEDMPEARMEVLIRLVDTSFENAKYRTYDPFLPEDRQKLNLLAPNLTEFLGGRSNRLILPNSKLQPNRAIPHRQDRFRTLHIQAALYEMATESDDATDCIDLLQEAYRHGFGSVAADKKYLRKELAKDLLKTALSRWKESERTKIATELQSLWGLSLDVPVA